MNDASTYPKILGIYSQRVTSDIGAGTTRTEHLNVTYWYVRMLSDDHFEIEPLSAEGLPSGIKKRLRFKEFITAYVPEPFYYHEHPVDVVERLEKSLKDMVEGAAPEALGKMEQAALEAFMGDALDDGKRPGSGAGGANREAMEKAKRVVDQLLAQCPICRDENRIRFNSYGVALRKDGHFDQAIGFFSKAILMEKNDENIYFNMARARFELGQFEQCRKDLEKAVSINPDFIEARKFLRYLEKQETVAG